MLELPDASAPTFWGWPRVERIGRRWMHAAGKCHCWTLNGTKVGGLLKPETRPRRAIETFAKN